MNYFTLVILCYVMIITIIYITDTVVNKAWKRKYSFSVNLFHIILFYPVYLLIIGMFIPFFVVAIPYNLIKTGKPF